MQEKIKAFIKEHRKVLNQMQKDLKEDENDISLTDLYYDEGYINGGRFLLEELAKIVK